MKRIIGNIIIVAVFVLTPSISHGAIVQFTGFEAGAGIELGATGGTNSYSSTVVKNGGRSHRTNPTTTATGFGALSATSTDGLTTNVNNFTQSQLFTQFWFRMDTCPTLANEIILQLRNSGGGTSFTMYSNYDCSLTLKDSSNYLATSSVLTTATWYQIRLDVDVVTDTYNWYIDGSLVSSGTGTFFGTAWQRLSWGKVSDTNGNTVDYYFDDIILADIAYPDSTTQVLASLVNANGTYTGWSGGTNASDYLEVDDNPNDSSTTYTATGTAQVKASYNMQDTATVGISGTILAVKATTFVREAAAASTKYQGMLISGAVEATTTDNVSQGTSYDGVEQLFVTDPNTGVAWTTAAIDSVQIGGVSVDPAATTFRMTSAILQVAFFVPAVAATINSGALLMSFSF